MIFFRCTAVVSSQDCGMQILITPQVESCQHLSPFVYFRPERWPVPSSSWIPCSVVISVLAAVCWRCRISSTFTYGFLWPRCFFSTFVQDRRRIGNGVFHSTPIWCHFSFDPVFSNNWCSGGSIAVLNVACRVCQSVVFFHEASWPPYFSRSIFLGRKVFLMCDVFFITHSLYCLSNHTQDWILQSTLQTNHLCYL